MTIPQTPRRLVFLAALALLPIIPYLLLGYAGQDLPFHVCSWLDMRDGWLSGHLMPGWAAAANFGLGDPHLTLYPPVSNFLGGLLTLVLPLKLAPAAFAYFALMLSGFAMYTACKDFVAEKDRVIAAALYMLGPYMLTSSLVRFAAAELLVQAWLPLIALCFYRMIRTQQTPERRRTSLRSLVLLGLLLGFSWITNIPASIVLLYGLATAALVCAIMKRSAAPLLHVLMAEVIAIAIAGFYLLPAWKERAWIHSDTLLRFNPLQLLLFMPHADFPDNPLLIVCWIFLCVQAVLVVACLRRRALRSPQNLPCRCGFSCRGFILLQTPLAIPLWRYAPELSFVQFPLRFLSVIGVALPLLLLSRGTRLGPSQASFHANCDPLCPALRCIHQ